MEKIIISIGIPVATFILGYIAGVYDLLGIPYTGNGPNCLGNCLSKLRTKQILISHGIRTPRSYYAQINDEIHKNNFILKSKCRINLNIQNKIPIFVRILNQNQKIYLLSNVNRPVKKLPEKH